MKAGIILDKDVPKKQKPNIEKTEDTDRPTRKKSIKTIPIKALEAALEKAIKSENYEKAAQLRDELNKRKNN